MRYRVLLLSAFISIFAFPSSLFAQAISGSILDAGDNPVGGSVRLILPSGDIVGDFWTDEEGNFQSWPLANGSYHAVTIHTHEMLDEAWENIPCENLLCNVQAATPIVIAGSDVAGINFVLDPITVGGHIVGFVEDNSNSPLAEVGIQIRNAAGEHLIHINTGPDGSYQSPLLANDTYFVKTVGEPFGLGRELYDDYHCLPPDICEDPAIITTNGTPVVISGVDEIGIDFELTVPSGAMISGQVTDADIGIVLPDVHMNLLNVSNDYVANTDTDALGNYYFSGLVDGTYKVYAVNVPDGYTGELYGGDHCHEWNCDLNNSGTTIIISGGVPAPGKDIMLDFSGTRLLGTITRSDSGAPVSAQYAHMGVDLFSDIGEYMGTWPTNRAGQYQVLLAAGNYYLAAVNDWRHHGLVNEVWEDIQCTEFCDPVALHGTLINVADGASVVADFELDPGFELSGTIRAEGNLTGDGAVNIWDSSGLLVLTGWNDGGGYWTSNPLPAGTYYATVHGEYFGMESQLFDGLSCPQEYCDVTAGTPIVVTDAPIDGIDFNLSPFSEDWTISGSIRDPGGHPVYGAMRLFDPFGNHVLDAGTDHAANFQTQNLANGTYFAITINTYEMLDEAWDNIPCENMICDIPGSTPIVVNGSDVSGIDFVLEPITGGGMITGLVKDGSDAPLPGVIAVIRNRNGEYIWEVWTLPDGSYQTPLLANDSYFVHTKNEPYGLGRELYDDFPCIPANICDDPGYVSANGTEVVINEADEGGIEFRLEMPAGAVISGQIIDADTGIVLPDVHMNLLDESGNYLANSNSDPTGNYYFSGLLDGSYKVYAVDVPYGYTGELYGGDHCHEWNCDLEVSGTPILVSGGTSVSGRDIVLDYSGTRLLGTITRSDTGAPVSAQYAHVGVDLFNDGGEYLGTWATNSAGQYQVNLPGAGSYYLAATNDWDFHSLINEAWNDIKCWDCNPMALGATLIPISDGATVVADFVLDPGYKLSGTISVEGSLTEHGHVNMWDDTGQFLLPGGNDGGGNWTGYPLPSGTYYATVPGEHFGVVTELYDDFSCPQEFCDVTTGTPIVITDSDVGNINFDLAPASFDWTISGSIRDGGGNPVGGAVRFFNPFGNTLFTVWVDELGNFLTPSLADGTYYAITMRTNGTLDEAWKDFPCVNRICDKTAGTPIVVAGSDVIGINFVLAPITVGGHLSGLVEDSTFTPLPDVGIVVRNSNGDWLFRVVTGADGRFNTSLLTNDTYFLHTRDEPFGLARELYDDYPCPLFSGCGDRDFILTNGTPVVMNGSDQTDIDFMLELPVGGIISGRVSDANIGIPLPDVHVALLDSNNNQIWGRLTDSLGDYYFAGLPDGAYKVFADDVPEGYTEELFGGDHCPDRNCDFNISGTPITIDGGAPADDKNIDLDYTGTRLLGTLTRSDTGAPVSSQYGEAGVELFNAAGEFMDSRLTNDAGQFQINLPAGDYYLVSVSDWDYHQLINEAWNNIKCHQDCDPLAVGATLISVPENHSVVADFNLDPEVIFKNSFEGQ